jgi:hypothetical protein
LIPYSDKWKINKQRLCGGMRKRYTRNAQRHTYEADEVPGMEVVPRTLLFHEIVTRPGKEISAWKGPVFSMLPIMATSIVVAVGLVIS